MKISISTNINNNLKDDEIKIIINASNNSEYLNKIIQNIQSVSDNIDTIVGAKDNNLSILNVQDILYFYSCNQNNYCKTKTDIFRIKKKLYELEENLDKKAFIRISNSCIANVNHIESFDLSKIGNIIIKFVDGSREPVSKRKISSIMKFLRERGN